MEIIIVLTVALLINITICAFSDEYTDLHAASGMLSIIFLILFSLALTCLIQSSKTAQYLNKTYNTKYTAQDIFWNEKLIMSKLKIEDNIIDDSSKIKLELINK
jgi:hypothetical protein